MDQKDRVRQDHGKRDHRDHISSDTLTSLITRKRLLVATIRVLPISSPTSAVKGKRGRGPEPLWVIFYFLFIFFIFDFFSNIPIEFSQYSQNKVDEILGEQKFSV